MHQMKYAAVVRLVEPKVLPEEVEPPIIATVRLSA
jgi:hypothetical protein